MTFEKRRTAVRRGHIYCSPFCGKGCTYTDFCKATKKGEVLAKRLGKSWTPRVWENLGWHFSAVAANGRLNVHGDDGLYTAYLNIESGGSIFGSPIGKTPEEAVKKVVENAMQKAGEFVGLLLDLREIGTVEDVIVPEVLEGVFLEVSKNND